MSDVERFTKLATCVDSLAEAWAFVMEHIDTVGPSPSVHIGPVWVIGESEDVPRHFEVSVSGSVPA